MTGIIDIGSNTIRLVTYDRKRQNSNISVNSEIIKDTKNGILTREGIDRLCMQLEYLKSRADCDIILAFATYAIRVLKNKNEVKDEVLIREGINIDILSGKEEAEYDFYGLLGAIPADESGVGVDLGGGSGQIMIFEKGQPKFLNSYPIGCRKVKNKLGCAKFCDNEDVERINDYIDEQLEEIKALKITTDKLYMMGGTAKTAAKIYSYLKGGENVNILQRESLLDVVRFIEETPSNIMKNIVKNRYDNISVGILIMKRIAEIVNANKIHIKKCGVRDGYLLKNI